MEPNIRQTETVAELAEAMQLRRQNIVRTADSIAQVCARTHDPLIAVIAALSMLESDVRVGLYALNDATINEIRSEVLWTIKRDAQSAKPRAKEAA